MFKKRALVILCVCLTFVGPTKTQDAQNLGEARYEKIVKLSRELKKYEKEMWGVNPGNFATEPPIGQPLGVYAFLAQDKLTVVKTYLEVEKFSLIFLGSDEAKRLNKRYSNLDIYIRKADVAGTAKISQHFLERDRADQIRTILHEDFHSHRSDLPLNFRGIEEGFADAFSFAALRHLAANYFHDPELGKIANAKLERELVNSRILFSCYISLNTLYRSRLPREEKLKRRGLIFEQCSKELGELFGEKPMNNASLALWLTYKLYFRYATEKIDQYGVKPFIACYTETHETAETEKKWLADFERCLLNKELSGKESR